MTSQQNRFRTLEDLAALLPEGERSAPSPKNSGHDGKGKTVRIFLDTKGRKGKAVTVITGFQHNPETLGLIARTLKQALGTGGTVRGLDIEIQGDQREKAAVLLREMNYVVR